MSQKLNRNQILQFLKDNRQIIKKKYHIKELRIFGSFSTNSYTDKSDVDLLYSLKENEKLNFSNYMDLLYWLEDNFGRKVELINIHNINPIVLKNASSSMQSVL